MPDSVTELEQAIDAALGSWVRQNSGLREAGPQPGRPDSREDLQARADALQARLEDEWRERQAEEQR